MAKNASVLPVMPQTDLHVTSLGPVTRDGRARSTHDKSVWAVRFVPMGAVEGASADKAFDTMKPVDAAVKGLSRMVRTGPTARRSTHRGGYREYHVETINIEEAFRLSPGRHVLAELLNERFGHHQMPQRLCVFAVRLHDKFGGGNRSFSAYADAFANWVSEGQIPMSDFDDDFRKVDRVLTSAGLVLPRPDVFARYLNVFNSWWNYGETPQAYTLPHEGHLHVFHDLEGVRLANKIGVDECDRMAEVPGQSAVTMATVSEFDWNRRFQDSAFSPRSHWIESMLQAGAIVVSVRGLVEPNRITRKELDIRRNQLENDAQARAKANVRQGTDKDVMMEQTVSVLEHYEEGSASEDPSPTLIDSTVVVGLNGRYTKDDLDEMFNDDPFRLMPMVGQQAAGVGSTWIGSTISGMRIPHEFPSQVLAASGANALMSVGDSDGALFGLTEHDRQPSFLSPTAASDEDYLPLAVAIAATGAGKTVTMLNLVEQWAKMKTPGVLFDFKQNSDHSDLVQSWEEPDYPIHVIDIGRNETLARGIVDPIKVAFNAPNADKADASGHMAASSMIMSLGLFSRDYEPEIAFALQAGVSQGNARSTGSALRWALNSNSVSASDCPPELITKLLKTAEQLPAVGAMIGFDEDDEGNDAGTLTIGSGATLVMSGARQLALPDAGHEPRDINERVDSTFVRMVVLAATMSLSGDNGGWIAMDEAWMFLQSDPREIERLGRLARQQNILPLLFTQRAKEIVDAQLSGFISRVFVGPMPIADSSDPAAVEDVRAACRLARVDPDQYVDRITQSKFSETNELEGSEAVQNVKSMYPLKDADGNVTRGTLWLTSDMKGRVGMVEALLTKDFLFRASTNPNDVRKRRELKRERELVLAEAVERDRAQARGPVGEPVDAGV